MKRLKHETSGEKYQPGAQEPGEGAVGAACPHNSGAVGGGGAPTTFHVAGNRSGSCVPKLGIVSQRKTKWKPERNILVKIPSFLGSAAHLADKSLFDAATNVLMSLS